MDLTTKILLTIQLEGVLGPRTEKKEIIPYKETDIEGNTISGAKVHRIRENLECYKRTAISKCAYDYFISNEAPYWFQTRDPELDWEKLSRSMRLQLHLQRLADYNEFSYEILND